MSSWLPLLYAITLFMILFFLAFYLFKQIQITQNFEQKLKILQNRINLNQGSYEDFYKLGQFYLRKKIYSNAINLFQRSLKAWNYDDTIGLGSLYNTIGFMYFNLKQYEYAIYYYKQAIFLLPDYSLALINLAVAYEKLKFFKEAYNIYSKVIEYDFTNKIATSRLPYLEKKLQLQ